jgi:hypothetical protein
MPTMTRRSFLGLKVALSLWGVVCALWGAAQGAVIDLHAADAHWAGAFLFSSYYSVLLIGIFGFVSARVVSILLGLSVLCAFAILLLTQPFSNGLGLNLSFQAALAAIIRGPALVGLLLFLVSRSELRQEANDSA